MLREIVVLVDAGSCPRGRNLDNGGVTLGSIFLSQWVQFQVRRAGESRGRVSEILPGTGPNIRLALREDIVGLGGEGVKGVTRNSPSTWRRPIDLMWLRTVFLAFGKTEKCGMKRVRLWSGRCGVNELSFELSARWGGHVPTRDCVACIRTGG